MAKMTTQEVLQKLEKLRAFAERDCGNETENAIRIINRLCKEYNIDFYYKTFVQKQAEEATQKEEELKRRTEQAKKERELVNKSVTISHIDSKAITIALCQKMRIPYCVKGWKLWIKCTPVQLAKFSYYLNQIKSKWRDGMIILNHEIIDKIDDCKF